MPISSISQKDNIFKVISEKVAFPDVFRLFCGKNVKKQGQNLVALCPFHKEKNPSFTIYPNGYRCYGCGETGTAWPRETSRPAAPDCKIDC